MFMLLLVLVVPFVVGAVFNYIVPEFSYISTFTVRGPSGTNLRFYIHNYKSDWYFGFWVWRYSVCFTLWSLKVGYSSLGYPL